MKTAEDRARLACKNLNLPERGIAYMRILDQIEQAMQDQRHACAEAINAVVEKLQRFLNTGKE